MIGEEVANLVNGFICRQKTLAMRETNRCVGMNMLIDKLMNSRLLITNAGDMKRGQPESICLVVAKSSLLMK